ncbi:DoxX family protein [Gramella sp. MT6]|mgnify:FL=1|nr:DoxX family protein [Gramella sp. MT6]
MVWKIIFFRLIYSRILLNYMKATISVSYRSVQLFRILLSGIFLVASFNHILNLEKTLNRIDQARFKGIAYFFGNPEYLVIISGIVMMIAGFCLLIGYKTRLAAIALASVIIPITLTVQVGQIHTLGPLFKNIAILGGLLFFILNDIQTFKKQ